MLIKTKGFAALAGCAAIAACGGSSSNGVAGESTQQIAHDVANALSHAKSVHISGNGNFSGSNGNIDMTIVLPKSVSGTFSFSGKGTLKLLTTDGATFYMTPDSQFISSFAGSDPTVVQLLSGRCIVANSSSPGLGSLTQGFNSLAQGFQQGSNSKLFNVNGITKGAVTTVNGQQVLPLKTSDGRELDIAAQGDPLLVRLVQTGSNAGTLNFDNWNSASISSATPTNCIDFNQITQGNLPTPTP